MQENVSSVNIEHCPKEGPNGGALIYVKNDIIYKVRNDLKIYQSEKLESVFIEIIKSNNRNIMVGCVYRHPSMEVNEFNSLFLNTLSENLLSEKNKEIVLMGDFNIDLLKYEKDHNTADFLDQMYSASLVPHITSPTRITSHSRTLIDNIFSMDISENAISGNNVTTISDHLAQFLFLPIDQFKTNNNKNIYQHNFKSFNQQIFLEDIQYLNWKNVLELEKKDVDYSFDKFFLIVETLLDIYAPIQKLTKAGSKLKSKPWLTRGIMTSIKKKNIIYKKFIKAENSTEKNILYNEFKCYRNLITK